MNVKGRGKNRSLLHVGMFIVDPRLEVKIVVIEEALS